MAFVSSTLPLLPRARLFGRGASTTEQVEMQLQVNCGHASARQLKLVLTDAGGDNQSLQGCVDEVLRRCDAVEGSAFGRYG